MRVLEMDERSQIEKLFYEEIKRKNKSDAGPIPKKGKGVISYSNSPLRSPYYFMSTKEKKLLISEVSTFNMYDGIITLDEFVLKDAETQKAMLTHWRELYPNKQIMNEMGIGSNQKFAGILNELELPKKARGSRKGIKRKTGPVAKTPEHSISTAEGLEINYTGIYDAQQVEKILAKLQLVVEGENEKYHIQISIREEK